MHRQNAAEQAIRNCKNHFISGFSTTDPDFRIRKWYQLISKCLIALNILSNYKVNTALSAYAYLYGPYDFNKYPMEPPGTCVIVHEKPGNITSWGHRVTPCWYIGPSLDHYRHMQYYMPATDIVRITDTLQYIPKAFVFLKTTTEDCCQQEIGVIIATTKDPSKTLPFLSYGDATKIRLIRLITFLLHPRRTRKEVSSRGLSLLLL